MADVLRLLAAIDEPEDHLKKLFEWQIERALTIVRLAAAGIAGVVLTLLASLLRGDLAVGDPRSVLIVMAGIFVGAFLADQYVRVRTLEREYVAALGLLRELAPLVPLLRLYGIPNDD